MLFIHLPIACYWELSTHIKALVPALWSLQSVSEEFINIMYNIQIQHLTVVGVLSIFQTLTPLMFSMTLQSRYVCYYANDRWGNWGTDKVSNLPKVEYVVNGRAGSQACIERYSVLCALPVILISEFIYQTRVPPAHRRCKYYLIYIWRCQQAVVISMNPIF